MRGDDKGFKKGFQCLNSALCTVRTYNSDTIISERFSRQRLILFVNIPLQACNFYSK